MSTPQSAADPAASLSVATASLAAEIAKDAAGEDWQASEYENDTPVSDKQQEALKAASSKSSTAVSDADDDEDDSDSDTETTETVKAEDKGNDSKLLSDIKAAIKDKDVEALNELVGEDLAAALQVKADDHKALRHEKRKVKEALAEAAKAEQKLNDLEGRLKTKYTDPVFARKAFQGGNLDAFFETVEKWAGVPYADVQKAWHAHVAGKPAPKLAFKDHDAEAVRAAKAAKEADNAKRTEDAKTWISTTIKGDKLASPDITDRVYKKLQQGWNNGLRDPKKALELVKADIVEENKAQRKILRDAGLLPKKAENKGPRGMGHSAPKASSLTTAAPGKSSRRMSDRELAQQVMSEMSQENWRK